MSQGVPTVSSAEVAIASGILGAGVGYVLAPRKYDLEELLTQEPDIFEKSVSKRNLSKAGKTQKEAYNRIISARKKYFEAVKENCGEVKLAKLVRTPALESAYKNVKKFIPKARTQYAVLIGILSAFSTMVINYVSGSRN